MLPNCRELVNTGGHRCGGAVPDLFGYTYKYGSGVRRTVCIDCRREDGLLRVSDGSGAGSDAGKGGLGCSWDRQVVVLGWGGLRWFVD